MSSRDLIIRLDRIIRDLIAQKIRFRPYAGCGIAKAIRTLFSGLVGSRCAG